MNNYRVMFVCLGNICRSPLAEAVMAHLLRENHLADRIEVASSGTDAFHQGESADSRMRQTARQNNIDLSAHRAQKLTAEHLREFDLILAMDQENLRGARSLATSKTDQDKIRLLREFDPQAQGGETEVPDPYYGGRQGFDRVYAIVERSCQSLVPYLSDKIDA